MNGFINSFAWLAGLIRATLRPRPRVSMWKWGDVNIVIPEESGGPHPGQLQSRRFPIFRGLFDLAQRPGVHFVTLCASARVGKTLFSITILLYWIAERVGSIVWLDPSAQSAKKFVRQELEHFLQSCKPVWKLAVVSKTTWTTLFKTFRGKILRIVASGAEADMHGFNAELGIINERDRCRDATSQDASSADKIIARTRLFPHTRLVLDNSTPGLAGEFSPIWKNFQRGSQHFCYLPCPHCSADRAKKRGAVAWQPPATPEAGRSELSYDPTLAGWQRLTFAPDKKMVPFDANLEPLKDKRGRTLPRDKWREESTGQIHFEKFATWIKRRNEHDATKFESVKTGYDVDAVERGATYQCAHCKRDINQVSLRWMLARFRWLSHNPRSAEDRISAHVWAAYSPFESWGVIAKEFLESKGDVASLIKFHNFTLGLPFVRQGTAVKEDDLDRVIARTPVRYVKGQIPMEAEALSMTVDKQEGEMWYSIRAWGVLWDHPDWPTWSALVDWGRVHSYDELLEVAGLKPDAQGDERRFAFNKPSGAVREYMVTGGLIDSGFQPESVYEFCLKQTNNFDPYKGVSHTHTRGCKVRVSKVLDEQLDLWLCWSDFFAANLYYDCIKYGVAFGEPVHWWLPVDIDGDYRKQLCDEFQGEDGWTTRTKTNHLGDTEKMHRCFCDQIEDILDEARAERGVAPGKRAA